MLIPDMDDKDLILFALIGIEGRLWNAKENTNGTTPSALRKKADEIERLENIYQKLINVSKSLHNGDTNG